MNKACFLSIIIFLPFILFGQDISGQLKFNRENWNVGLERFSGTLTGKYDYLKNSMPDLIQKELLSSDIHVLTLKEIDFYRQTILKDADNNLIAELSKSYNDRDQLVFKDNTSSTFYNDINSKISQLKDQRLSLAFLDKTLIKTPDMLHVNWVGSNDDQGILEADQYSPSVISKEKDLDFLIYGNISEIEGYFLIEVYGYDRSADNILSIYEGSGSIDELEFMAIEAANELRSIILGRPWSILTVNIDNPDALIYSDGELIGIGTAELNTAVPGPVFLEAIGEDNSYWSREADLIALETNSFSGMLTPADTDFLILDSEPARADVYIGARWVGKTPVNLPRYHQRNIWVTVKSEGYYDKSFEVSAKTPEDVFIKMIEEDLSELEIFDMRKKEYYRSLGIFSISVGVPVFTWGLFMNSTEQKQADIRQGIFWGSIGISGGLLVDVFVKLSRYIKAAEALAD